MTEETAEPRRDSRTGPGDRGVMATELAIIMPIVFLIALAAVYLVQAERHSSRAQQAADAAARAASLASDESTARSAAHNAAEAVCEGAVHIGAGDFEYHRAVSETFTPGRVRVIVSCTEEFSGFGPLTSDRSRTELGVAVSVIEYWRPGASAATN